MGLHLSRNRIGVQKERLLALVSTRLLLGSTSPIHLDSLELNSQSHA